MAGEMLSLQAMVDAGREKKKAEQLAQRILGKKTTSQQPSGTGKAALGKGNLASRVGVTKRSSSSSSFTKVAGNLDGHWLHDLHHVNNPQKKPAKSFATNVERKYHLYQQLAQDAVPADVKSQVKIRSAAPSMKIKGLALGGGPHVVVASNFAPGTTAGDIQTAMEPIGGPVESCVLISSSPTVMAELVFAEKEGAENIVDTYNNHTADGRVLHVYMKSGGPTPHLHPLQTSIRAAPAAAVGRTPQASTGPPLPSPPIAPQPQVSEPPQAAPTTNHSGRTDERDAMDVDDEPAPAVRPRVENVQPYRASSRYGNDSRYQDDRHRGAYDRRGDGPGGGGDRGGRGYGQSYSRGLYSDGMSGSHGGDRRYR